MSVLCGTDFSAETHDAIRVAALFAHRRNERLRLIHAIDAPVFAAGDADLKARVREDAERHMHRDVERARQEGAPAVEASVETGPPDEVLVAKEATDETSLIVLGALGRRSRQGRRVGGTAERVAESAHSPVLVVRAAEPLKAWLRGERPLRVVVGDDLTHVSAAALRFASGLRRLGPCEIRVCHVYSLLGENSRLGIGDSLHARISELDQVNLAALRRHAGPSFGGEEVGFRVEGTLGRVAEPLLGVATEEAADLVVVGTAQRTTFSRAWHGWASQIVLNDAQCSVACIPAGRARGDEPEVVPALRRVLVATDFSPIGNQAVAHAHAIVAEGGIVHMLHVAAPDRASESHRRASIEKLRKLIPESVKHVETRLDVVSDASVPAAITAAAERLDVDVVCMGTHGHSGLLGALLGSVAREVSEHCRRQVLLVSPRRTES